MRFGIICFLDHKKNDSIIIKNMYKTKEDAFNNLERVAIEYIKELQGKQQAEVCKQDKTPEKLLADVSIKEGMYIKKVEEHILLYEKTTVIIPGKIWNSNSLQVNKIGQFSVTEYNFDDVLFKCDCLLEKRGTEKITINRNALDKHYNFLDELKTKMEFGILSNLRPVN